MQPPNIVIFLAGPYDTFHRRPMIRALARELEGHGSVLCIEPWGRRSDEVRQVESNLYVHQPSVKLHETALFKLGADKTRRMSLARRLRKVIDSTLGTTGLRISWLYKPEQLWLAGMAGEDHLVYECYDEYRYDLFGQPLEEICELERELLGIADKVFVTSGQLLSGRAEHCKSIEVVPNGADFELFSSRVDEVPEDLLEIPRPRVGHIGNLMECLDLDLFKKLIESRPNWSFVHIGPVQPGVDVAPFSALPNLHFLGVKPQDELPAYMAGFDAGIMLFKKNRFTNAVDPLKLYEYLAARVPVVSTRFAPLGQAENIIWTAGDLPEFLGCLEDALTHGGPQRKLDGLALAMKRDWSNIARQIVRALEEPQSRGLLAS